jgi:predicted phosphodiesterase
VTARADLGRVAVLCDIHGNLPALEAVLAELAADPPDAVVIGGDVAAGPQPVEVLTRLRALEWPVHYLRGNADRFVVMGYDGTIPAALLEHPLFAADAWTATFLSRADRDFLDGLPPLLRFGVDGLGDVLFCHATARSDEERVTVFTPEERLARILAEAGAPLLVGGHTHRQFDRTAGARRMVNAGSVGRPYEHRPGAYWLRLGPDVQLRRTDYDTEAASRHFHALGYPFADGMLAPVDADAVAERYERVSGEPLAPESLIA